MINILSFHGLDRVSTRWANVLVCNTWKLIVFFSIFLEFFLRYVFSSLAAHCILYSLFYFPMSYDLVGVEKSRTVYPGTPRCTNSFAISSYKDCIASVF